MDLLTIFLFKKILKHLFTLINNNEINLNILSSSATSPKKLAQFIVVKQINNTA